MRRRGVTAAERDRPVDLLDPTARVFVKQHVEHFEALTGFETENTYDVYATADGAGAPLYRAKETSNVCCRQLCKAKRPFVLNLSRLDNGATFLRFERSYRCYWESLGVIDTAHGDISLGSVDRAFAFFSRSFTVKDAAGMVRFTINSPMFDWWTFHITDVATGARVGAIRKKWSGLAQELFTDADNFGTSLSFSLALALSLCPSLISITLTHACPCVRLRRDRVASRDGRARQSAAPRRSLLDRLHVFRRQRYELHIAPT